MANDNIARDELLQSLQGQTLQIPDLQALLQHWPQYINLELDRLRGHVEMRLQQIFPEGRRLKKTMAADAGLFAASWWPYARYQALEIATDLSIWLFVWDDELDSTQYSTLALNISRANAFRAETLDFAEKCLIAERQQAAPPNQIQTFMKELRFFVEMTAVEQHVQMSKKLPSVDEYRHRRMGSSAVRICLAIAE
ncbi:MAG: hypothetical protein Q9180_000409 [Flavoplaca navasiana]